jgi:iron complex outermembrane recepter protein
MRSHRPANEGTGSRPSWALAGLALLGATILAGPVLGQVADGQSAVDQSAGGQSGGGQSGGGQSGGGTSSTEELKRLSVEQLMNVEVTSVSKTKQPIGDAAAAVYVITHDDIVRSGATTIPEILRLAPNLEVFQTSASGYVITARGFSGNSAAQSFSDKLLVLVDGRSVYSPLYSGVYWDTLDTMIPDIDRIEVISGPGATLWGANAMNGVINIITRKAGDTQGTLLTAAGGNLQQEAAAQYGGQLDDTAFRAYAKGFIGDALRTPAGGTADDGWSKAQAGFRTDWSEEADSVSAEGDAYRGNESAPGADTEVSGANLVGQWIHRFASDSQLQVLSYFDHSERFTVEGGAFVLNTYDIELQHSFDLLGWNSIVWGVGERLNSYGITGGAGLFFQPESRTLSLGDVFAQDTIALTPRLRLIVGLKLEDDPYSGTTPLPDGRLAWNVNDQTLLWSAVSRAIRSATPFDRDVQEYLDGTLFLVGGEDFRPETVTAYEAGLRTQPSSALSFSVSTYYNAYDELRSIEFAPDGAILPLHWGNGIEGATYGVEAWGDYQVLDGWRLSLGGAQEHENLRFQTWSSGLLGISQIGDDPSYRAMLRSSSNLTADLTFDATLRYVSSLPDPGVPAYTELNARLAWHLSSRCDLALTGFNLLHAHHQEFAPPADIVGRSVLASVELHL